jgi:hypothetical protein
MIKKKVNSSTSWTLRHLLALGKKCIWRLKAAQEKKLISYIQLQSISLELEHLLITYKCIDLTLKCEPFPAPIQALYF